MKRTIMAGALALAATAANAGTVTYYPDYPTVLVFEGQIEVGDDRRLDAELRKHPKVDTLALNSNGGLIKVSFDMVNAMMEHIERGHQITTWVSKHDTCASACFTLFASGMRRFYQEGAQLGVHSMSDVAADGSLQSEESQSSLAATAMIARAYAMGDVPAIVITKMLQTPNSDMAWLDADDLRGWAEKQD